jgi:hypothetical protein
LSKPEAPEGVRIRQPLGASPRQDNPGEAELKEQQSCAVAAVKDHAVARSKYIVGGQLQAIDTDRT